MLQQNPFTCNPQGLFEKKLCAPSVDRRVAERRDVDSAEGRGFAARGSRQTKVGNVRPARSRTGAGVSLGAPAAP
jgi:hypothetical protein